MSYYFMPWSSGIGIHNLIVLYGNVFVLKNSFEVVTLPLIVIFDVKMQRM